MQRRAVLWTLGMLPLMGGCAALPTRADPATVEALAPTGRLRVAFLLGPLYAAADPATGRLRGVAVDLGEALALRLGVPFEPQPQRGVSAIVAGLQAGSFDVVMMGISAERGAVLDFSPPYLEVEQGLLQRPGLPPLRLDEIDRAGLRIGVLERASADAVLSRRLQAAQIVRVANLDGLFVELAAGRLDLAAATKSRLYEEQARLPGTRLLEERLLVEPVGIGVPKGRAPAAAAWVARFVADARASGLVSAAIDRARLRGVSVPTTG